MIREMYFARNQLYIYILIYIIFPSFFLFYFFFANILMAASVWCLLLISYMHPKLFAKREEKRRPMFNKSSITNCTRSHTGRALLHILTWSIRQVNREATATVSTNEQQKKVWESNKAGVTVTHRRNDSNEKMTKKKLMNEWTNERNCLAKHTARSEMKDAIKYFNPKIAIDFRWNMN